MTERTFHPQVEQAIKQITHCIIDLIIEHKGSVSLQIIEEYTGLKNISINFCADILRYMHSENIIEIQNGIVISSVGKLRHILEQEKPLLPAKHGQLWGENDYVKLAELSLSGVHLSIIAKKLDRTQNSVDMSATLIRKAYKLIPIIQKYTTVKNFASKQISLNSKV